MTTTTTRKLVTWLGGDARSTPTTSTSIIRVVPHDVITTKTLQSTPRLHVTAKSSVPRQSLPFVSTTWPPQTVYDVIPDVGKNSPSMTLNISPSSVGTVDLPVSRGASKVDYPDVYGGEDTEPSLSYSSTAVKAATLSRSLSLVLGLIACITIVVTVFVVLFIVYRYRAKSTPSRRASLASVTSLGYSKAPTTDTSAPAANAAIQVTSPRPTTTHDCTAIAASWPATASSEFYGYSGNDNMESRSELMGTSLVCATYGAAHSAFMTTSMTYGGDGGCKTSHAKEWFV